MPLAGLEDVISHIEALTEFTQKAWNDTKQAISLLNSEGLCDEKSYLTKSSQRGTCAIIQIECCVYVPDESSNVAHLVTHMKNQIAALDDPLPSLGDILEKTVWFCKLMP